MIVYALLIAGFSLGIAGDTYGLFWVAVTGYAILFPTLLWVTFFGWPPYDLW